MNEEYKTKPKILILSLAHLPFIGGAEIAVSEITKRLGLESGWEFHLLCARMDRKLQKKEKIGNVNVYRIGFGFKKIDKYIFTFFGFFKAFQLYQKNHYKIIWQIMASYASFAVLFKIFTKAKVFLTMQEGDPTQYITSLKRFKIFRPVYNLYFKKVDKVQVISNFLAKWAQDLGIKKEKIVVVPNGININNFQFPRYNFQSNDEFKSKENTKIILTVSRLVEKNGTSDLINAISFLKIDAKLLIIGDGILKSSLENLVKDLELKNSVEFLGQVEYEKIKNYYKMADIFVRPSRSEGFGNVFIEAMSFGIPVIATQVGGIPDFLIDYKTGWFCEVQNPKSIAEKIEYVLDEKNKEKVLQVVANAKKMVQEKYTWEIVAKEMAKIFNSLIDKNYAK